MILYAVELEMDASLREEYLAWLGGHVREMLALPGFVDAEILARIEPAHPTGAGSFARTTACATMRRGRPISRGTPRACVKPESRGSAAA